MPLRILTVLALSILTLPSLAIAQEAPGTHPAMTHPATDEIPATTQVERYGWQIGLLDTAAVLMVLSSADSDSGSVALLGGGIYLLGGPAVHAARGNPGRAFGSLALRVGLPLIGARLAESGSSCDPEYDDYCGDDDMVRVILGGMAGVVAAGAIDWIFLAKDERKVGPLSIQPSIAPTPGGGGQVGIMGVF